MGNISVIGPPTVQSIRANCLEKDISVLKEPQLFKAWPKTVQKRIYVSVLYRKHNFMKYV
jgi:hypothetical protein